MPDEVYFFRNGCGPDLSDDLVEAYGPHVIEFIATHNLWGKFNKLISEPRWTGLGGPYVLHMIEDESANSRIPSFEHAWSGS